MSPAIHLSIPLEIHFRPTWGRYFVDRSHKPPALAFKYEPREAQEKEALGMREDECDPWEVRSDFLSANKEGTHLDTFAILYGRFAVAGDICGSASDPFGRKDFQEWCRLLVALVKTERDDWHLLSRKFPARKVARAMQEIPIKICWKNGRPAGLVRVRMALDAILFSIQIDKIRGLKSKTCAECFKEFVVTSKHERVYCSKKCAHRVAVRKYRVRQKRKARSRSGKKAQSHGS
jgi:hypothetical protein